jgi:hypothetical protein
MLLLSTTSTYCHNFDGSSADIGLQKIVLDPFNRQYLKSSQLIDLVLTARRTALILYLPLELSTGFILPTLMPQIFGRKNHTPHPYGDAVDAWRRSSQIGERAMARNIMYDHRVSELREQAFDKFVTKPCDGTILRRALDDYFKTHVRNRVLPDYVYARMNGNNLINANVSVLPDVNKDRRLVRAINLNNLAIVFQWARSTGRWERTFERFPSPYDEDAVMAWLDARMTPIEVEELVGSALEVLSAYRKEFPFQPSWATTLDAFSPYTNEDADRWLQLLGVSKPKPNWIILLCYPIREAGTIARPTQLDGGWYEHHFPSPPCVPLESGGHPMDLRISPKATGLLPEYIHKQIDHTIDHWNYLGALHGRTSKYRSPPLVRQRRCHFELLVAIYGPSIYDWMDSWI